MIIFYMCDKYIYRNLTLTLVRAREYSKGGMSFSTPTKWGIQGRVEAKYLFLDCVKCNVPCQIDVKVAMIAKLERWNWMKL